MVDIFRITPSSKWILTIDGVKAREPFNSKLEAQRAAVILINSRIDQYKRIRKALTDEILAAT